VFNKRSADDFRREIESHLELEADDLKGEGASANEAHRRARSDFGSVDLARERFYRKGRIGWLDNLGRDLRYGLRGLFRNPGFALVAILTLALAIGANTAVFSLLDQALLRALPVRDPQQLVVLSFAGSHPGHTHSDGGNSPGHQHEFSYPMYRDLRDKNTVFSGLIGAAAGYVGLTWNNHAESAPVEMVTGNYFEVLGVRPALGRLFVASDETVDGGDPVAVLSFNYWKTHLAGESVVGKTLLINGTPFTITGVAAPGFHSMVWGRTPDVFVPITMQRTIQPAWNYLPDHGSYWMDIVGRLRAGEPVQPATASLNALYLDLRRQEFAQRKDQSVKEREAFLTAAHINLEAGAQGFSPLRDDVKTPLTIVMCMVLVVVAMAVVNVASLLLVRAATRVREFSVRYALGATGRQVLRQLLAEGLLLGAAGAALGVLLAPRALDLLIHWMSADSMGEPFFSSQLDWRILAFTIAATAIASLIFSLAPAVQFWNPRLAEALRQNTGTGKGGSLKFRRTCVALQIGFSLLLIVAAGLFVRTIQNLHDVDPGFTTDHLLTFDFSPAMAGYPSSTVNAVEQRALDAIAALPGVRGVGATNDGDLAGNDVQGDMTVPGYTPPPDEDFNIELPWVSNGYLQTLGIPLVAGRYFDASDTASSNKVAVVNESFVRHYFASPLAALGRHVNREKPGTDATIVGVLRDVKHESVRDPAVPTCYELFTQADRPGALTFYVRTGQQPTTAANSIRAAIGNIDPKLVVEDLITMQQQIDDNILAERTIALLAGVFGALAAALAGIGLYGILAYSTAQRTREIGIRMALGAQRGTLIGLLVREVIVLAGTAIASTIPLAILATWAIRSQLFGVSFADPAVYAIGVVLLSVVAALAAYLPARRAASVNPVEALRTE